MQALQDPSKTPSDSLTKPPFSPYLDSLMKLRFRNNFIYGSVCYNQKHNMIISCPADGTIQFDDANTLKSIKGRYMLKINCDVTQLSFDPETEAYIMGCSEGSIAMYNTEKDELKKLREYLFPVLGVTFLTLSNVKMPLLWDFENELFFFQRKNVPKKFAMERAVKIKKDQ